MHRDDAFLVRNEKLKNKTNPSELQQPYISNMSNFWSIAPKQRTPTSRSVMVFLNTILIGKTLNSPKMRWECRVEADNPR